MAVQLMFVGNIINFIQGPTNVSCVVEDGTGQIDVRLWIESSDEDTGKLEGVECVISESCYRGLAAYFSSLLIHGLYVQPRNLRPCYRHAEIFQQQAFRQCNCHPQNHRLQRDPVPLPRNSLCASLHNAWSPSCAFLSLLARRLETD